MNTQSPPPVAKEIRDSLTECGFTLLETQAMPYEWIRLKLKHVAKPHPFELDYDGSMASLIDAVEYCGNIVDGVLAQKGTGAEQGCMQQMRKDLVTLADKLVQFRQC